MGLYEAWKRIAYDTRGQVVKRVWDEYLAQEKRVYETILREKTTHITGTVKALSERFNLSSMHCCVFLDGIHEAVDNLPDIETIEEDTPVTLDIDFERLYRQMVEYKAEALYTLPQWDGILSPEQQQTLFMEQKNARTVVRSEAKIGRNTPCPCGSGKKYKKCCGAV